MLWAMGAILLHFQGVPQAVVPAAKQAQPAPMAEKTLVADASISNETTTFEPGRLTLIPAGSPDASPAAAAPAFPAMTPIVAITRRKPEFAGRVTDGQKKTWIALSIAGHGAATFDAWTTRRAITRNGAQELNPLLKPFARNNSIYAATQVAPTVLDFVGRRMMTSRHSVLRHTWWLPQVLGSAASFAAGTSNLRH
jgi:hypothetical protein